MYSKSRLTGLIDTGLSRTFGLNLPWNSFGLVLGRNGVESETNQSPLIGNWTDHHLFHF